MNQSMSLGKWAAEMGISYRTAWRMVKAGKLPRTVESIQFPNRTIRILRAHETGLKVERESTTIYARINQRADEKAFESQLRICTEFCRARGWEIERIVRERAPGFGPKRRRLHSILTAPPHRLVVASPSVLSRFDLTVTELLLRNAGCELVVVNREEERNGHGEALEDLTDAISSTCQFHYGIKRGRALVEDLNRIIARRDRTGAG